MFRLVLSHWCCIFLGQGNLHFKITTDLRFLIIIFLSKAENWKKTLVIDRSYLVKFEKTILRYL